MSRVAGRGPRRWDKLRPTTASRRPRVVICRSLRMKIVHAADLHLDSPLSGLERYEGAPVDRIRGATRAALVNLVDLALDEMASLVLLAGDLFDDDWKDYSTALFFRAEMRRLAEANVNVVWLRGNHDAASQLQKHLELPKTVFELSHKRPDSKIFEDIGVAVHGQGFATRAVVDNLALSYPEPVSGLCNIGLLHTSITGREGHAPYAPCLLSDLVNKGYEYWALGHVHQREVLCEDPWVVFPGNLQGRHVREPGDKGATLIEVTDGHIDSVEHCALDVVRFGTCRVDAGAARSADEILGSVRDALAATVSAADGRLVASRVVVAGATEAHGELVRDPERFVAEIRASASEIGGDGLWIEKVCVLTRDMIDLGEVRSRDDAIGQVFRGLSSLRESDAGRTELAAELAALGSKLPPSLRSGPLSLGWDAPEGLDAVLDDVEQLLLSRLGHGGEP